MSVFVPFYLTLKLWLGKLDGMTATMAYMYSLLPSSVTGFLASNILCYDYEVDYDDEQGL